METFFSVVFHHSRPVAQKMCCLYTTSCLPDVSNVLKSDASNPEKKRKHFHHVIVCYSVYSLADQIFYRSFVYRQQFCLRSYASSCFFMLTFNDVRTVFPACLLLVGPSNFRRSNHLQCMVYWEFIIYFRQ